MAEEHGRTLGPDDNPGIVELLDWHKADHPECPMRGLYYHRKGWGCPRCNWVVAYPEGSLDVPPAG